MSPQRVSIAAIREGGRYFLQRRALSASRMPGLWEFPGGKAEPGESPVAALARELREELDWAPEQVTPLATLRHAYGELEVELHLFLCVGASSPHTALAWGWFWPAELAALPMPDANQRLLRHLE